MICFVNPKFTCLRGRAGALRHTHCVLMGVGLGWDWQLVGKLGWG